MPAKRTARLSGLWRRDDNTNNAFTESSRVHWARRVEPAASTTLGEQLMLRFKHARRERLRRVAGSTGTSACAMIGPRSYCSST